MRFFTAMLSVFFIVITSMSAQAQQGKKDLFKQCMSYKKDESFCNCAMGKPYEELSSTPSYSAGTAGMERHLEKLEERYNKSYEQEKTKGGLSDSQIARICDVVDEYYAFLDEIEMPYNKTGMRSFGKNKAINRGAAALTNEQRQALTLKRVELNKKIHDLNHEYQRGGAMGSFSGLGNGVCVLKNQIAGTKEELEKSNGTISGFTPVSIRSLIGKSEQMCGG